MRTILRIAMLAAAGLALFGAGVAVGQRTPPDGNHLVAENLLATIDLANEIDGVQNLELRVSRAVVEPGGHIGLHSHRGDPTIVYILGGVLTNHHDDGMTGEVRAGQAFAEFGPRSHWVENRGATPATFIAANVHRR